MRTQVAIVGGGPGGAASALFLGEKGIDSIIVEAESFPRFHIGESMTGWVAETVRKWGLGDAMLEHQFPVKLAGTVYGTSGANRYDVPITASMGGAKRRQVRTWQVKRSAFDKMLLDTARERGAGYVHGKALEPIFDDAGAVKGLTVRTADGEQLTIEADAIIDASGRKTWLSGLGIAAKKERGGYENQIAVFSHLKGVVRNDGEEEGNTLLFYREVDHWAWLIPVDPEVVSLGIVTPVSYYKSRKETKEEFFYRELREMNPNLAERVRGIELVEPVYATANFSYRIPQFTGKGWLCVGDAHRFIDPFFSFGIHLALAEAEKAAAYMADYLDGKLDGLDDPFEGYAEICERGMDTVQTLMDSFWANPLGWGYLLHYTEYGSDLLDIFGGRIYEEEPLPGLVKMRRIVAKARASESDADSEAFASVS